MSILKQYVGIVFFAFAINCGGLSLALAQGQSESGDGLRIEEINVRFSVGFEEQLRRKLAAANEVLKVEQDKLDEARTRRKSVSRAMAKMMAEIKVLTARVELIEQELENTPVDVKNALAKTLEDVSQGSRPVALNVQIGSFVAKSKDGNIWDASDATMAATVVVSDYNSKEPLFSFVASDIDMSEYSAEVAGFVEGFALGAAGVFGVMAVELIRHQGRSELIANFSDRTVAALFPQQFTN